MDCDASPTGTKFWKANPHRWGEGRTHLIDPDGTKTLCGVQLVDCPGQYVEHEYDCRGCAKVLVTQEERRVREERWRAREQEWRRQEEERQREREERQRLWRERHWSQREKLVPFGRYKGQPVEVLVQDRQYCEWLMAQDWFRESFQLLYSCIADW